MKNVNKNSMENRTDHFSNNINSNNNIPIKNQHDFHHHHHHHHKNNNYQKSSSSSSSSLLFKNDINNNIVCIMCQGNRYKSSSSANSNDNNSSRTTTSNNTITNNTTNNTTTTTTSTMNRKSHKMKNGVESFVVVGKETLDNMQLSNNYLRSPSKLFPSLSSLPLSRLQQTITSTKRNDTKEPYPQQQGIGGIDGINGVIREDNEIDRSTNSIINSHSNIDKGTNNNNNSSSNNDNICHYLNHDHYNHHHHHHHHHHHIDDNNDNNNNKDMMMNSITALSFNGMSDNIQEYESYYDLLFSHDDGISKLHFFSCLNCIDKMESVFEEEMMKLETLNHGYLSSLSNETQSAFPSSLYQNQNQQSSINKTTTNNNNNSNNNNNTAVATMTALRIDSINKEIENLYKEMEILNIENESLNIQDVEIKRQEGQLWEQIRDFEYRSYDAIEQHRSSLLNLTKVTNEENRRILNTNNYESNSKLVFELEYSNQFDSYNQCETSVDDIEEINDCNDDDYDDNNNNTGDSAKKMQKSEKNKKLIDIPKLPVMNGFRLSQFIVQNSYTNVDENDLSWSEINSSWGQVALLIAASSYYVKFQSKRGLQLIPFGQYSRILYENKAYLLCYHDNNSKCLNSNTNKNDNSKNGDKNNVKPPPPPPQQQQQQNVNSINGMEIIQDEAISMLLVYYKELQAYILNEWAVESKIALSLPPYPDIEEIASAMMMMNNNTVNSKENKKECYNMNSNYNINYLAASSTFFNKFLANCHWLIKSSDPTDDHIL